MRWEDERYVRVYTRDTIDWLALSFEAQGLLTLILRKADRAGVLKLGRHGKRGVAAAVGHAHRWGAIGPALDELLADGVVVEREDALVVRNFIEAQEAKQSDTARKRGQRERDRDKALAAGYPEATSQMMVDEMSRRGRVESQNVTETEVLSQNVTETPEMSRPVVTQDGHAGKVTPSLAVPNQPSRADEAAAPPTNPVTAMGGMQVAPQVVRELAERRKLPRGPLIFEKPTSPAHAWLGTDFEQWFQWLRQQGGFPAETKRPHPRELSEWFSVCLMTPGVDVRVLKGAAQLFGKDPHWEAQGFPFRAFMSQWDQWVSKEKSRAAAG